MAQSIIRGLKGRVLSKSTKADVVEQALEQLRVLGVRAIIIDEVQHIAENLSDAKMKIAVKFLQYILDESKASLILVGLPTAQRFINFDASFQRRCLATELLYPYAWICLTRRALMHCDCGYEYCHAISEPASAFSAGLGWGFEPGFA